MGLHPLGRHTCSREYDACEERCFFKRDMMLVKGGTYFESDITIPKGCLDPIKPLLLSL